MRNVSAADLVSAWERTLGRSPVDQALVLLSLTSPGDDVAALAALSVGQRDARLLTLREKLFGPRMSSVTVCPRCQQRLELAFDAADIRQPPTAEEPSAAGLSLTMGGYRVQFRLPTSADLSSLEAVADPSAARQLLLERCIQSVTRPNEDRADQTIGLQLPVAVVDAVAARMSEADPQSDTRLALSCPDCHHHWEAVFDIASYLVREVHDWAIHVLREVHALARAYGWREADILAMTAARRQVYLELAARG
jgi:hypothetical protein